MPDPTNSSGSGVPGLQTGPLRDLQTRHVEELFVFVGQAGKQAVDLVRKVQPQPDAAEKIQRLKAEAAWAMQHAFEKVEQLAIVPGHKKPFLQAAPSEPLKTTKSAKVPVQVDTDSSDSGEPVNSKVYGVGQRPGLGSSSRQSTEQMAEPDRAKGRINIASCMLQSSDDEEA